MKNNILILLLGRSLLFVWLFHLDFEGTPEQTGILEEMLPVEDDATCEFADIRFQWKYSTTQECLWQSREGNGLKL